MVSGGDLGLITLRQTFIISKILYKLIMRLYSFKMTKNFNKSVLGC